MDVVAADGAVEVLEQIELFEPAIDPAVGGAGDDGEFEAEGFAVSDGFGDSGQWWVGGELFADPDVTFFVDGGPIEFYFVIGEIFEMSFW